MSQNENPKKNNGTSRGLIFRYIASSPFPVTKQKLADALHLSMPTITNSLSQLLERDLIRITGADESFIGVGRKPQLMAMNPLSRMTIGLSIHPESIHFVAVDLNSQVIAKQTRNIEFANTQEYFSQILAYAYRFITLSEIEFSTILGIGIALPGIIDSAHQRIISSNELRIEDEAIPKSFKKALFPIRFENDAIASGRYVMEHYHASKNLLFLSIGKYVKSSLFIDEKPYYGNDGRGVDIAHLCLIPEGRECYCGHRGCVERYLSLDNLGAACLNEAKTDSKKKAKKEYITALIQTIINLHRVYNCDIILGGENMVLLSSFRDILCQEISNIEGKKCDYLYFDSQPIESSAIGASLSFISEFIQSEY